MSSIKNSDGATVYMTTGFYVFSRVLVGMVNLLAAYIFNHFRVYHLVNAVLAIVPTAFWIGALWVNYPYDLLMQWLSFLFGIS